MLKCGSSEEEIDHVRQAQRLGSGQASPAAAGRWRRERSPSFSAAFAAAAARPRPDRAVTVAELIMWGVVAGIGFPAAFLNRTAFALCASWLVAELICRKTGENLPILVYFIFDYFVLLVIFTKPETRDMSPYRTFGDQIKALWREHCATDVFIAAIFPVMWLIYVAPIGEIYRWWGLWGLVQVQFFAAGREAYCLWRAARSKARDLEPPGAFKLGLAGHG